MVKRFTRLTDELNRRKPALTTAIFIDLQQVYDRVWRKGLLVKMSNMVSMQDAQVNLIFLEQQNNTNKSRWCNFLKENTGRGTTTRFCTELCPLPHLYQWLATSPQHFLGYLFWWRGGAVVKPLACRANVLGFKSWWLCSTRPNSSNRLVYFKGCHEL